MAEGQSACIFPLKYFIARALFSLDKSIQLYGVIHILLISSPNITLRNYLLLIGLVPTLFFDLYTYLNPVLSPTTYFFSTDLIHPLFAISQKRLSRDLYGDIACTNSVQSIYLAERETLHYSSTYKFIKNSPWIR